MTPSTTPSPRTPSSRAPRAARPTPAAQKAAPKAAPKTTRKATSAATRTTTGATTQDVAPTPAAPPTIAPAIGRIPVVGVGPVVECGRWPAKAVVGEAVEVTATVFREGHDAVAATAVLVAPDGTDHSTVRMSVVNAGLDSYRADLVPDGEGSWGFRVEGWSDPYATWHHDASIKVGAGVDVELMLAEGAALLERAADRPACPSGSPPPCTTP